MLAPGRLNRQYKTVGLLRTSFREPASRSTVFSWSDVMTTDAKVSWKAKEAAIRALEKNGRVDPAELIEVARDPEHPCHSSFTWDIEQAAQERWRDQARELIRSVKFEVLVEDVGNRVCMYVPSGDDDSVFVSLPKIRSKSQASAVVLAEVSMLLGNASRAYGIALSKTNIVGADVVAALMSIRDQVAALKEQLGED